MRSASAHDITKPNILPRDELLDFILGRPEPVIVLEAAAGMGKSTLLSLLATRLGILVHHGESAPDVAPGRWALWDIAPSSRPGRFPEDFPAGKGRIVIAKRPETPLPGLSRAILYGYVLRLRTADLLITETELARHVGTEAAARIMTETGGWPLLAGYRDGTPMDKEAMENFLTAEFLRPLSSSTLVGLEMVLSRGQASAEDEERLAPLLRRDADGALEFAAEAVRAPLAAAVAGLLSRRAADPEEAKTVARAYAERGRATEAIVTFQKAGFLDLALETFTAAADRFYIYYYGSEAFDRVLAGFPTDFAMRHDLLVICLALQACKRGDVALARRLLEERFGKIANDLSKVFAAGSAFPKEFRAFRFVLLIYEDVFFTEQLLEQVFTLLSEFPTDAHLERGSFYNSILEFYIRGRRFAEAEDVASRARYHYDRASAPILSFYIALHQAIMRLMMGDALTARRHAADAAGCLARAPFESPADARLLVLLDACIDYEAGRAGPLARFLNVEFDEFAHGEIWPSLIEFALYYGSQALSEHFSTIAARGFLDRWRVYQMSNRQFRHMIEIREAVVLQNGNRWQEASERLAAISSRVDRSFVLGAENELRGVHDRDEIALALAWLRQLVYEMPTRPGLERQLGAMLNNLHATPRQRIGLEIWLAFVFKRQRNLSGARSLLQKVFEDAAGREAIAPLTEERIFLTELLQNRRVSEFLDTSPSARQVMRLLRESGLDRGVLGADVGLSRRETKMLLMISEGGSNKFIANTLGLSEATVKFHLGNAYRKLGCRKRKEAIGAARALGLVS
jgi:DNA-binding CsgD family transcriptional regulator